MFEASYLCSLSFLKLAFRSGSILECKMAIKEGFGNWKSSSLKEGIGSMMVHQILDVTGDLGCSFFWALF